MRQQAGRSRVASSSALASPRSTLLLCDPVKRTVVYTTPLMPRVSCGAVDNNVENKGPQSARKNQRQDYRGQGTVGRGE